MLLNFGGVYLVLIHPTFTFAADYLKNYIKKRRNYETKKEMDA